MTKMDRFMLRVVYAIVLGQFLMLVFSGCTPHAAHKIWDGYTLESGWATTTTQRSE